MKFYLISMVSNLLLGMISLHPLVAGLVLLNGGFALFKETTPTLKQLIQGSSICLAVVVALIGLNIVVYKKSKEHVDKPKALVVAGVLAFIVGVFSFMIGVVSPDVFDIM